MGSTVIHTQWIKTETLCSKPQDTRLFAWSYTPVMLEECAFGSEYWKVRTTDGRSSIELHPPPGGDTEHSRTFKQLSSPTVAIR